MKKTNYIRLMLLAIICCLSTTMFAQTQVTDSLSFATALADLQSPTGSTGGTGGVIQLNASLVLRPWKQTYLLASTATAPIEINTQQFSITVSGTNATADSTILQIGNNMNIHGTSTVLTNLARGIIRISGGQISSTTTVSGTTTVAGVAGWVFMSGGTVSINATGVINAYALGVLNNFALVLRGGTISTVGDNTRALSLTDNVTPTPISGATITATGSGAYAIQSLGANSLTIGDNMTITTSGGNDAALVGGGATSKIVIPSTASNVVITSTIPYKLDNSASAVLDLRGPLSISANPVSGTTLATPGNIVLTASGNASMALAGVYYSFDTNPTTASTNIASGGNAMAASATTTIKASIGKNGIIDSNVFTFVYTVTNPSTTQYISSAAGLLSAYNASKLTPSGTTTQIELTASFPIASTDLTNGAFTITPDANHPIVLNAKGFTITLAVTSTASIVEFGGSLTVTGTATTGLFIINGSSQNKISGGSYTLNANGSIFQTASGGNTKVGGQLLMSNSSFEVAGTSSSAKILNFASGDYLNISATNCNFKVSAAGIAFNFNGGQNISFTNCILNNLGTAIPFYELPGNQPQTLTINGLALTMSSGTVFNWAGSKAINTVVKDLTVIGSATSTKPATSGTGVDKFYDFRAFTPTVDVASGNYTTQQTVTPGLTTTTISPVDAGAATFVYTLDGTDPILTSLTATPISISTPTTIKMAAKSADGLFLGKIYTFPYTFMTTGITDVDSNNGISIYPTVVENTVTVNKIAKHILVVDLAGKMMLEKSNTNYFDMSNVKSGVYLVKVEAADNTAKTIRVVKL
ncbi:MAG: T9SS type A sorting domain-containing protein [Bacteroidota bacterium]|nr:T9SS type A sorting domain-containing protein [Bacteroidota bacterium]